MKILKRLLFCFALIVVLFVLFFFWGINALENRHSFSEEKTIFEQQGISIESLRYGTPNGDLFYVKVGKDNLPILLMIHGSPGDWTAWKELILSTDLLDHYQLIIPDRPPYHLTTASGENLKEQSNALSYLMEKHCQPCIVAGHSYGGALALQLSVDYTDQIIAVVSIAGTISLEFQTPKWYNKLGDYRWVQYFLTDDFSSSNQEMLSLSSDLHAIENQIKELDLPFYLFQGGKDILVNPVSPFNFLGQCQNVTLSYSSDWDHFVIWNEMDRVAAFLQEVNR